MTNQHALISIRNICKDFKKTNGAIFTALEGVSFDVYENEFVAILGLSGSGKSTLLRCMSGLLKADRGTTAFAPLYTGNMRHMSFVFQSFGLFPWFTVRENIAVAIKELSSKEQDDRIDKVMNMVALSGFDEAFPRELNNGMKQRVGLCRAVVCDPQVLFMDEPFGALDPLTSETLRMEISRLWTHPDRKIRAIVMVTHSIEEAIQLADRVVIMASNPGTVHRVIQIPLKRPRTPHSDGYTEIKNLIEQSFGEMHLSPLEQSHFKNDKVSLNENTESISSQKNRNSTPLINTSMVLIEGLIIFLSSAKGGQNIYALCDAMGESIDRLMPAVMAAEILGFVVTPGIVVGLSEKGRQLADEHEPLNRKALFRSACLSHAIFARLFEIIKEHPDGVEKEVLSEQIILMLPFEDADVQIEAFLKWGRYTDMLSYDAHSEAISLNTEMGPIFDTVT